MKVSGDSSRHLLPESLELAVPVEAESVILNLERLYALCFNDVLVVETFALELFSYSSSCPSFFSTWKRNGSDGVLRELESISSNLLGVKTLRPPQKWLPQIVGHLRGKSESEPRTSDSACSLSFHQHQALNFTNLWGCNLHTENMRLLSVQIEVILQSERAHCKQPPR